MEREKTISSRCSRQRQFFGVKSEYFFRAASNIEFCVFPRLGSSQGVSDKPQTMSGLSGANKGAHTKVLKLSADCGHTPWNAPNLEKHRSLRMFDAAWLEIPDFAIRMSLPAVFWNFIFSDIPIIKTSSMPASEIRQLFLGEGTCRINL